MIIPPDEIRAAVGDSWRVALRTSEMTGELHANAATLAGMLLEMGGTPDRAIRLIPFPRTARKSIP